MKTASGDVTSRTRRASSVDTASGDVRARDVEGASDVRTASGDVSIGRAGGTLSANLVSGDLVVDEAAAGSAGHDRLGRRPGARGGRRLDQGAVRLGRRELAIKPGQRLYVDASSVSGTMSSELGLDDTPPVDAGGAVGELRVRTISGDLNIIRAAAVGV